jgi:hypothetical protein
MTSLGPHPDPKERPQAEPGISSEKLYEKLGFKPHSKGQGEYLYSDKRFNVPCCGRRYGKSQVAGHRMTLKAFKPDTWNWIVGTCADEETEILTKRGWLSYEQLMIDDVTLTLNDKGKAEWQPIEDIVINRGVHRMIHIKQRGHDSLTTPYHRWLVGYTGFNGYSREIRGYRFTTTEQMTKPNEFVLGSAKVTNLPTEKSYPDSFVELIGWYWTEGSDRPTGDGLKITQNPGAHMDRILVAAGDYLGKASSSGEMLNRYDENPRWAGPYPDSWESECQHVSFNTHAGRAFREAAPDKVMSPFFITQLTQDQLELLIDVSVMADGHERWKYHPSGEETRQRVVVQSRKDRLEALQMVCQLANYQTTLLYQESRGQWTLSIFERNKMWLGQKSAVAKREEIEYHGNVWCPRTANGTWLARRNGTVFFTGNSYRIGEKEFRVVWDDFNKLNILRYCKKAYSQHQGDMYIETPWHTNIQVVSADNQDSLVGEGLSHVIMSEAAKHNRSTWEQYIEPALSDHRGSADLPSTPQGFNWYHGMFMLGSEAASMHAAMAHELGLDQYRSFHFPTWENTFRYPGGYNDPEIQRVKNVVTENWFRQEYGAEFTATTGSIFSEWDASKHVLEHYEFNPTHPNYITFDYGYANPFVALDIQITPSDEFIVWREYYVTQKSTPEHAQALLERGDPPEFRVDGMWGDPRGADEAATLSLMLGAKGWGAVQSFDVRWKPAIEQMQRLLMCNPPKLLISKNCPNLIRQMGKLHVKEQGKQAKFDLQEQAGDGNIQHKVDDHAVDALRYFIGPYTVGGASSNFSDLYGMNYKGSESDDFFTLRTRVGLGDDVFTIDRQF